MMPSNKRFFVNPMFFIPLLLLFACLIAILSIILPRYSIYVVIIILSFVAVTGSFTFIEGALRRFILAPLIHLLLILPLIIIIHKRLPSYAELSSISMLFFAIVSLLIMLTLAFMLSDEILSFHPFFKILQMAKDFLRVRWRTFLMVLTSTIIYAAGLTFFSLIISGSALILFSLIVACNVAISAASNIYKRRDEILSLVSVGLNPDHLALLVLAEFLITGFLGGGIGYSVGMYILILSQLPVSTMAIISSAGLMATVIVATTAIMLLASIPHAIKISMLVTPSIKKRWWKGEPVFVGWPPTLSFKVPIKVTEENVVEFFNALLNYITSLKYSINGSLERIEDVKTVTLKKDFFQLQFTYIYNEAGMPSLAAENEIRILRETDSGKFIVEVTIKVLKHQGFGESLYGFLERMASAYRKAAFEIVSSYKYESGESGVNERESFIL